jgi:hypothetical protein
MTASTIFITILGTSLGNMVVSAASNYYQGDDIEKCAKSGFAGGVAGGILAVILGFFGVNS